MEHARLLIDPPAPGAWNMAVDEVLLERASMGVTTLRFYAWSEPTLSLGYFQAAADRDAHAASLGCPLVRRASGGGAIVHDRELTYSFATSSRERFVARAQALYDAFHQTLIESLESFGVRAQLCDADQPRFRQSERFLEPFLCFQRHTRGDVLIGADKIAGSAQRRSRSGLLQHGSILLDRSACAPELPGINDRAGIAVTDPQLTATLLIDAWLPRLVVRLGTQFERQILTPTEEERVQTLTAERFANPAWNARR